VIIFEQRLAEEGLVHLVHDGIGIAVYDVVGTQQILCPKVAQPVTRIFRLVQTDAMAPIIHAIAGRIKRVKDESVDVVIPGILSERVFRNKHDIIDRIGHIAANKIARDVGALWENFVIAERMKLLRYQGNDTKQYFWRTTQQQEIDLIEEVEDEMLAFEIKWNPKERVRFSQTFMENYPTAKTHHISPTNMEEFLMDGKKAED